MSLSKLWLLPLVGSVGMLVACGPAQVGKWKGQWSQPGAGGSTLTISQELEFKADNTFTGKSSFTVPASSPACVITNTYNSGTWTVKDNSLTMKFTKATTTDDAAGCLSMLTAGTFTTAAIEATIAGDYCYTQAFKDNTLTLTPVGCAGASVPNPNGAPVAYTLTRQ